MTPEQRHLLTDLITAARDGTLDAAGWEQLGKLAGQDAEALRLYALHRLLQARLEREFGTGVLPVAPGAVRGPTTSRECRPLHWRWVAVGLAAALLVVLGGLWFLGSSKESIGHVSEALDCRWPEHATTRTAGSRLASGETVELLDGFVELHLDNGVRLIVQGPASLQLESAQRCYLAHGVLTAQVPREAAGWAVGTPSAEVIDRGTAFGVAVTAEGRAEVHVFEGAVESRSVANASGKRYPLKSGQAQVFGRGTAAIDFDRFRFVTALDDAGQRPANLIAGTSFEMISPGSTSQSATASELGFEAVSQGKGLPVAHVIGGQARSGRQAFLFRQGKQWSLAEHELRFAPVDIRSFKNVQVSFAWRTLSKDFDAPAENVLWDCLTARLSGEQLPGGGNQLVFHVTGVAMRQQRDYPVVTIPVPDGTASIALTLYCRNTDVTEDVFIDDVWITGARR
ncbi:MAG: FecR domain-containing protein [Planctomycetia bacterium]|nr:FecR domain-containing protein [Planctomycetia bacterium]